MRRCEKCSSGTEIDVQPVAFLELPHPFTTLEFYQSIVTALGAPNLLSRPTVGAVKRQVFTLLRKQKVEMLILDEIDYINESRHVTPEEAMETLKHVSNSADVSLVCIGSPDVESLLKVKFQYFRSQLLRYEDFDSRMTLEVGTSLSIFKHLLYTKQINMDIETVKLKFDTPQKISVGKSAVVEVIAG